ncbi:MAG: hypothetical protein IPI44_05455 [Sulfuritalea sp.]|nr:hypothetical protein [Sulfuritalea sp.]
MSRSSCFTALPNSYAGARTGRPGNVEASSVSPCIAERSSAATTHRYGALFAAHGAVAR